MFGYRITFTTVTGEKRVSATTVEAQSEEVGRRKAIAQLRKEISSPITISNVKPIDVR
jgi:hypothetical protein